MVSFLRVRFERAFYGIDGDSYADCSDGDALSIWDEKKNDPNYKLSTDWGKLDAYHAPSRNKGNVFPSAKSAPWTLDSVESPRNSGWFLSALAARRALTFLEQQAVVDAETGLEEMTEENKQLT